MAEQNNPKLQGSIVRIEGNAWLKQPDGKIVQLRPGDRVEEGQTLVTGPDGRLQLALANGNALEIGADRSVLADQDMLAQATVDKAEAALLPPNADAMRVIAALASGADPFDALDPTAAGLAGGGANSGHSFVRVLRIAEDTEAASFTVAAADSAAAPTDIDTPDASIDTQQEALAADDSASGAEDAGIVLNVLGNDRGNGLSITAINGTAISVGNSISLPQGTITLNADGTLGFVPTPNYNGSVSFTYTTSNGENSSSATVSLLVTPVNDVPTSSNSSVITQEDQPVSGQVSASDVDGDTLSFSKASDPAHGTVVVNADGSWTYTPAANYNGPDSFSVLISDGQGGTTTSTVTIGVQPVNDAPLAAPDSNTVAEDNSLIVPATSGPLANDTDLDGDALAITQFSIAGISGSFSAGSTASIPGVGALTINADGSYSFVPAANYNGAVPVATYTVSDGATTTTSTLTLGVTPINDAPVANADSLAAVEDTPLTITPATLLGNDNDIDGNPLSITSVQGAVNGTVAIVGGNVIFTPAPNFSGPASFSYTISDGQGGSSTATVNLNVSPVNDAPDAVNDSLNASEDTPLTITPATLLGNDTDAEGNPLSITSVQAAVNGTVAIVGGNVVFTPAPDYNGPASFSYTISDGQGGTDTATVNITVGSVNDAPVTAADTNTTAEDTPLNTTALTGLLANDSDVDGNALTVTQFSVTGVTGSFAAGTTATIAGVGNLTINSDGSYSFVPVANYHGAVPVATYTVSDGTTTATSTLTLNVTPVDDAFSDADETVSTNEDTPLTGSVLSGTSSVDGPVTVTGFTVAGVAGTFNAGQTASIAGVGTLVINANGSYTFTPAANYNGAVPVVSYTTSDGSSTDSSTLTISVTPVDDAFSDTDEVVSTNEDTALTGSVLSGTSSVDGPVTVTNFSIAGDATTYTAGSTATITGVGTLVINANGSYTFTPTANYNGAVPVVSYTTSDGSSTDNSTLTISVTPVDDETVTTPDTLTVAEDSGATSGNVLTNDSDADGALRVSQFVVSGTTYTIAAGSSTTATLAGVGTLVMASNGSYSFTPAANYHGTVPSVTYTATDGSSSATSTLSITVTPVNDAPVAAADTNTTAEDSPLSTTALTGVLANDSDVDGNALTVTQFSVAGVTGSFAAGTTATIAGVGSLTINSNGSYSFVPAANYNGAVPVATYTVSDGTTTATSTLTINVTPVNDAPVANADLVATPINQPVTIDVRANDTDVDNPTNTLTISNPLVNAAQGSVSLDAQGRVVFTPATNYSGTATITYTVTDPGGLSSTGTVTVTVGSNTPPDSANATLTLAEDSSRTLSSADFAFTDSDVGQSLAAVRIDSLPTAGTLTLNGNPVVAGTVVSLADINAGQLVFTPAANANGNAYASFSFSVQDNGGAFDLTPNTLSFDVTPVNDAPVAVDDSFTTAEDTPVTITLPSLIANDSDPDGDTVMAFSAGSATHGSLSLVGGNLVFTPDAGYSGPASFTYSIHDGHGAVDTATVYITVTPVNDAPETADVAVTGAEDTVLSITLSGSDEDNMVSGYVIGNLPSNGILYRDAAMTQAIAAGDIVTGSTVYFQPNANWNGATDFQYATLNDEGVTDSTPATASITVTPVNDAPVAVDDNFVTAEDTPLTISLPSLIANDYDVDGNTIIAFSAGSATHGTLSLVGGNLVFTPDANYNGPASFTYSIHDGNGGVDSATVNIQVTPVNDLPESNDLSISGNEDSIITVALAGSDSDGSVSGYRIGSLPANGTLYRDAAATQAIAAGDIVGAPVYFVPSANWNGNTSFQYATQDNEGGLDPTPATVSITVTPMADPTVTAPDTLTVAEDSGTTSGNVLSNDSDADGALRVSQFVVSGTTYTVAAGSSTTATLAGIGTLVMASNGSYSFTPAANYHGTVPSVTYTATDGSSSATNTLSITVTPVDDAFSDSDETVSINEDTALTGSVLTGTSSVDGPVTVTNFSIAGDATTYTAGSTATIAGVGTLVINANGSYTFTPAANYNGAVPVVSYTTSDGSSTDSSTLTISVTPVDDAFSDADEVVSTNEDTALTGSVLSGTNSVDGPVTVTNFSIAGDTTTYTAGQTASITGIGTLVINANGSYTFTPTANYNGAVPVVSYTTSDGSSTDTSTLNISVTPVDDAFSDANETVSTNEDTALTGSVLSGTSSVDGPVTVTNFSIAGDATTYAAGNTATITGVGTLTINANGSYTFTPAANYNGTVPVVSYTTSDGSSTDTSTLNISVTPVVDGFSDANETISTNEDTALTGSVLSGTSSVDGPVTVTNFNIAGDATTYAAGSTATITGVGTLVINANGSYTFTPAANYNGAVPVVSYTTSDGSSTDTSTLTISVTPVDDAFSDADETVSTNEDTALTGSLLSGTSSVDGPVTVTGFTVSGVAGSFTAGQTANITGVGTLTINANGSYTFTPTANYNGAVPVVSYTTSDGSSTDTSTLNISVTPVDDETVTTPDTLTVAEDSGSTSGNVLTNDSDADGALRVSQFVVSGTTYTIAAGSSTTATLAGVGTLVMASNGSYSFTPAVNYHGTVPSVTYTATDGSSSATSTLSITVTPVNDLPNAVNDANSVPINAGVTGNVLSNDSDVDGNALTVTGFTVAGIAGSFTAGQTASITGVGTLTINANGAYTFTPAANYADTVPVVTYIISDGQGGTASATLTLTMGANTPPVAGNDSNTVVEDTPATGNVLANDSDPNGNPLTVTQFTVAGVTGTFNAGQTASIAGIGTLVINANGAYTFTPAANYNGAVPVTTYTISDGLGGTASATLSLGPVTPVDDAFVDASETVSTNEDTALTGSVLSGTNSVDGPVTVTNFSIAGDATTYTAGSTATIAGVGTLVINANGSYTFTPAANYNGAVPVVSYMTSDGSSTDSSTLTISVTPVDDAFSDADEVVSTNEDTALTGSVLSGTNSVDGPVTVTNFSIAGDATTYAAGSTATITGVGTLTINANGSYTFTPAANYNGAVPVVSYTTSDGSSTDTSTLTISVTPVVDGFSDANETISTNEDTALTGSVLSGTSSVDGPVTVTNFSIAGDATTYAAGSTATITGVGTLVINANGSYTFTPAANYNGAVPVVSYTTSDGSSTDSSTLTISVTPVVDGFSDANETISTDEDTTLTGSVLSGTSSVDGPVTVTNFSIAGDATTYTAGSTATIAGVGTLVINANGSYTFTPAANYNGAVPVVSYTTSDGSSTDSSTLTISVTPVDDAFSDADEVVSTNEDTALTGSVLSGTNSVDGPVTVTNFSIAGDTTTYTAGQTASITGIGTLVINANGSYTFTPTANYNGAVPVVSYTTSDGSSTDTSTLNISVTPVDDETVTTPDTLTVAEDSGATSGNVLTNDSDADGALRVSQFVVSGTTYTIAAGSSTTATLAGVGTLVMASNGSYSFTPAANYHGTVPSVTYTATDGSSSATSTLSITVTPVNDAPVAAADTNTTAEDSPLSTTALTGVLANDSDVDGNALTVTQFSVAGVTGSFAAGTTATIAGVGSLTINSNGSYSFVPAANYNGAVPVATYTVSDGTTTATSTLTINVTPVADPTVTAPDTLTVAEDSDTTSGNVLSNDSDADGALRVSQFVVSGTTYTVAAGSSTTATLAGIGTLVMASNGSYSFTPAANYHGTVPSVTYTATDGSSSATNTLSITVTPVDDAFSDSDETVSINEDTALTGSVLTGTSSVDGPVTVTNFSIAGDATTYTAGSTATIAGVGTLVINANGSYTFTPAANYNGAVPVVSYTTSDGSSTDSSTLTISVTPVDDAFSDADEVVSTNEDTALTGSVLSGTNSVDGPVTVTNFSIAGDTTTYTAGQTASITGIGTLVINANGSYTFTPTANYNGAVPVVSYTTSDGSSTDTSTLNISVTPVDDAFSDANETVSTNEDTALTGSVLSGTSSVDGPVTVTNFSIAGDATTYAAGSTATITGVGTLTINANGSYTFTPAANYNGAVPVVSYTTSDGSSTDSSTLTISVTPVDDAFSDADELVSTNEDTALTGSVLSGTSSVDGPVTVTGFTVAGVAGTFNAGQTASITGIGTLTINANGSYTFTPAANYNGAVPVVSYTTSDGSSTDSSTLTISVTPVDDAFSDADETVSTNEDTALTGSVLSGTSSVDGPITVTGFTVAGVAGSFTAGQTASIAGVGTLVINANGSYTFTPAANYNGAVPVVSYTTSDGSSTDSSTLTISVTPMNDAPVATADSNTTAEDSTLTTTALTGVLANDSDVDGNTLTVTQFSVAGVTGSFAAGSTATIAGVGSLTINSNGSYSFVPVTNYNGAVPVATYTISDGTTTATNTLTINVTPVNDAPALDLDANNSTAGNSDYTTTYVENAAPVSIADSDISITDLDSSNIQSATITLTNAQAGDVLAVGSLPAGITASIVGNVVTLSGSASLASYQTAIRAVTYASTSETPSSADRIITVTVSDGSSTSNTATTYVHVTPVNDAPVAAPNTNTTAEDSTLTTTALTGVLANDSDVDGNTLTVTQFSVAGVTGSFAAGTTATIAGVGSLTINSNGSYSFVPAANYNGAVPVATYTVSDGTTTATSTLTINVTPIADPTVTAPDTLTVAEDSGSTSGNVLTNDSDADGALRVSQFVVSGTTYTVAAGSSTTATLAGIGTLVMASNGAYNFTPAANYHGTVPSVTYTATDGSSSATNTLNITVTPVADPTVTAPDTLTVAEDSDSTSGNVLTNDSDADGVLRVSQFVVSGTTYTIAAGSSTTATLAGVGTLVMASNGSYSFTPAANYHGTVPSVTYTATDGSSSATSTLSITVTPVNDAPVAAADTNTTAEDSTLSTTALTGVLANDSDVDGNTLTVTQFSVAGVTGSFAAGTTATIVGVGSLTINSNGSYSFVPAANYSGAVPVATYTVSDGTTTATSTLTINVTPVNDAPSTTGGSVTGTEDQALVLTWSQFNVTDVDGGPAQAIVITALPASGTLQYSTNGVTWTAVSAGQTVLKAYIDQGYLRFVPASNESGIDALGGSGLGNRQASYANLGYQVVDGSATNGTGNTGTLVIDIAPDADAPTVSLQLGAPVFTQTGTVSGQASGYDTYSVSLSAALTDTDGSETLSSLRVTGLPSGATLSAGTQQADGSWIVTQAQLAGLSLRVPTGSASFNLTASATSTEAGNNDQATGSASVAVSTNHGTIGVADTATAVEAGGTGNATAGTNPTGNVLTNDLIIDSGDSKLVSAVSFGGTAGTVGSALAGAYGTLTLNANGSYSYVVDNSNSAVQALRTSSNTLTETFTYTTTDGTGTGSSSTTLTVTIQGANDAPVAVADTNVVTRTSSTQVSVSTTAATGVLTNDTDVDSGDTERVSAINNGSTTQTISSGGSTTIAGSYGSLTIYSDGHYTYTTTGSRPSTNVQDVFTYTVRDTAGLTSQATLTINVDRANAAPIAAASSVTGTEDTPLVFTWANFNVSDEDGVSASLGINIRSLPTDGVLQTSTDGVTWTTITATNTTILKSSIDAGLFRFVPDANESGSNAYSTTGTGNMRSDYASFTYRGTDGTANSSTVTMTVDITPVADDAALTVGGVSVIDGSVLVVTPPASEGLTVRQYTAVSNISTTTVDTASEVLSLLNLLDANTASSTSISTSPQNYIAGSGSPSGIATDGAYRITGLIYLEAGHTYTFSSYMDDTALLSIGGTVVLAKNFNSWGNITASTYTPTTSGYYTLDWAVYNGDSVGAIKPYLSVDGGAAQELTTGNFKLYSSVDALESLGGVHDAYNAVSSSGGYYPVSNSGVEDTSIKLSPISVGLSDTDGSEALVSLVATNLLVGTVLSDGTRSFTATAGNTSVDITGWTLNAMTIRPPQNFFGNYALNLTATTRETATNEQAVNTTTLTIPVAGVADVPTAVADTASLTEDSGNYLASGNVLANDSDPDGDAISVSAVNNQSGLLGTSVAGAYGYFQINANGSYTYSLLNDNARINALNNGQSLTDRVSYTVTDATGMSSTATLTITITGSTDSYVASSTITGTAGADVLAGTATADTISALAGNDYIEAGAGHDVVRTGDAATSATQAQLAASGFMTQADSAMTDGMGMLTTADATHRAYGDLANGGDGNDALIGSGTGSHLLYGGAGDDYLLGGSDGDALRGGSGSDRIEGGAGSDVMRGDFGPDVFAWSLGDQAAGQGTTAAAAGNVFGVAAGVPLAATTDLVSDFSKAEGDVLDLRDLLVGENHLGLDTGNLSNYLHFELSNGNTVVHVSTTGGFAGGNYDASKEDQTIVLQNVNLLHDGSATLLNDNAVIQDMLKNNRLIVD